MESLPTVSAINELMSALQQGLTSGELQPPECPVMHHFSDNIYCREIFMPAGSVVVGKVHATRHLNIVLSGECYIWTVHGKMHLKEGSIFESQAGVQKVVAMETDVRFLTVHYNPENLREDAMLEGKYIRPAEQLPLFSELDNLSLEQCKKLEVA